MQARERKADRLGVWEEVLQFLEMEQGLGVGEFTTVAGA